MPTTILVAPAGRRVGLTTACLGLVRALDRQGVRVAFVKPVANREVSQSAELMALGAHILPVKSVPIHVAEDLLAAGDDQTLMEHVVEIAGKAGVGADVLIVEGMNTEPGIMHASRVNELMLKALDAELVLVAAPRSQNAAEVADAIAIAARGYGTLAGGAAGGLHPQPRLHRRGGAAGRKRDHRAGPRAGAPTARASRRSPRWRRLTGRRWNL